MERTFTFSRGARSFYSYWKEKIQPNHWQLQIDRLADEKITWEQFFENFSMGDHPALDLTTTKGCHSLLHLAIYQNREDRVADLAKSLAGKKNRYGLTPIEVAKFLGRTACLNQLQPQPKLSLSKIRNLKIHDADKLQNLDSFEYLDEPIFESKHLLDSILEKTAQAKSSDLIPGEKIWMGIYFNKEVQKGFRQKISLRWISEAVGFGIFASQKIPSCTFIGEYTGVIKEVTKKPPRDNYYCVRYTTWDIRRRKFTIDAQKSGNFTRFINHSLTPNLGLQSIYWCGLPRMVLVSLKEIEEGEQLTFDYGSLFWKECSQIPIPLN